MNSTPRVRAALAVGALMTAVGLGAVATPFLAAASASTVDSTPTTTISKADYEAAHPDDKNAWGKAMSDPSTAFCGGAATTSVSFTGNTTVPLSTNVGKVVIHAGSYVFIYVPGTAGVQYQTPKVDINGNMNSQAISWAVTCGEGQTSSSSTPTETESGTSDPCDSADAPESCNPDPCDSADAPESCNPDPCATENAEIPASCTPDPCVVDPQAEGCGGTVISSPPATTTTPAGEESVDSATTTPAGSLASTGGNGISGLLLALGLLLAGGGAALVLMTRRTGSHA